MNLSWTDFQLVNRGESARIFTNGEESEIPEYRRTNFISSHLLFTNEDLKCVCMDFYKKKIAKRALIQILKNGTDLTAVNPTIKVGQMSPKK